MEEKSVMTWNHRVVRKCYPDQELLGIHEVFYEDGVPNMVTEEPVGVSGEDTDELWQTLRWMIKALGQPILNYTDFEAGGQYFKADDDDAWDAGGNSIATEQA